jgi:hypothetical protein
MSEVVIAVAAHAAGIMQEEEEMTGLKREEMDGWEFKIVRSHTPRYRRYQEVQKLCKEEAKAGWEMLEKFDDNRIRFKRRVENRRDDRYLDFDPYRTSAGIAQRKMALIAIVATAILMFAVIITMMASR